MRPQQARKLLSKVQTIHDDTNLTYGNAPNPEPCERKIQRTSMRTCKMLSTMSSRAGLDMPKTGGLKQLHIVDGVARISPCLGLLLRPLIKRHLCKEGFSTWVDDL